jgi:hypothetical protein
MKKRLLYYPAFQLCEDGISIIFPDFPGCLPCDLMLMKQFTMRRKPWHSNLYGMEEDNDLIPSLQYR